MNREKQGCLSSAAAAADRVCCEAKVDLSAIAKAAVDHDTFLGECQQQQQQQIQLQWRFININTY